MPASNRVDPYKNFNFRVELDNVTVAGFCEVSGLGSEVEIIEYREGQDRAVRKLAGLRKYSNIVLKRGYTQSNDLWVWHRNVLNGQPDRRNGSIVLMDDQHADVIRWTFTGALPCKLEGPELKAKGNDVAIETLEIAIEGLERVS